ALLARPGASSRQPEVAGMREVLASLSDGMDAMSAPATLDGGDVVHLGRTLVVGRSGRTNDAGIEQLAAFAGSQGMKVVRSVVPHGVLHLQSAVTALGSDAVVGEASVLGQAPFTGVANRV